jgi:hypothetical protein
MNGDRAGVALSRDGYVIGPDGLHMSLRDLPPPNCTRWVVRRKAQVVLAIRGGLLGLEEALERYRLTQDELFAWGLLWDHHGMRGLRTTQLKNYRAAGREVLPPPPD